MNQVALEVDSRGFYAWGSTCLSIIITLQKALGVRASGSAAQVRKCSQYGVSIPDNISILCLDGVLRLYCFGRGAIDKYSKHVNVNVACYSFTITTCVACKVVRRTSFISNPPTEVMSTWR
jgi:hypothetical protein